MDSGSWLAITRGFYRTAPESVFEPLVLPSSGQYNQTFWKNGSQDAVCTTQPQISKAGRSPWARVLVFSAEEGEGSRETGRGPGELF